MATGVQRCPAKRLNHSITNTKCVTSLFYDATSTSTYDAAKNIALLTAMFQHETKIKSIFISTHMCWMLKNCKIKIRSLFDSFVFSFLELLLNFGFLKYQFTYYNDWSLVDYWSLLSIQRTIQSTCAHPQCYVNKRLFTFTFLKKFKLRIKLGIFCIHK